MQLNKIDINVNGKTIHSIIAPELAPEILTNRERDLNLYDKKEIIQFTENDRPNGKEGESFVPGVVDVYSDWVYKRLEGANRNSCKQMKTQGNRRQTEMLLFKTTLLDICSKDIRQLINNDTNILKSWIKSIDKGKSIIDKYYKQVEDGNKEVANLTDKANHEQRQYELSIAAYDNNMKDMQQYSQELFNSINGLYQMYDPKYVDDVHQKMKNFNDVLIKKTGPLYESKNHETKIGQYQKVINERQQKVNELSKIIENELQQNGLNLDQLKQRIQISIDKFYSELAGGSRRKKRVVKKRIVKKIKKGLNC